MRAKLRPTPLRCAACRSPRRRTGQFSRAGGGGLGRVVSTTLENEAIATVENEATQTDRMGDLSGGLGFDPAARCGRCSAAAGRTGSRYWQVDGRAGVGLGPATEVRACAGADLVRT